MKSDRVEFGCERSVKLGRQTLWHGAKAAACQTELFQSTSSLIGVVELGTIHLADIESVDAACLEIAVVSEVNTTATTRGSVKNDRKVVMTATREVHTKSVALVGYITALLLLSTGAAHGQASSDFSLFEPVDSSDSSSPARGRRSSGRNAEAIVSEAEFALIGTFRIGNKTSIMMRHVSGAEFRIPLDHPRMPIPGYERYAVIGADGESISIQYPQSVACMEFEAQGISCDASRNVATLTLTTAKAIMPTLAQTESAQSEPKQEEARAEPTNPFEVLRNRSQNSDLPTVRPDRFQPRRIDPADVPPGMRVVSTPFGDRLVQE